MRTLGSLKDEKIREYLGVLGYDVKTPENTMFSAAGFVKGYVGPVIESKDDLLLALRLEVDRKTSMGADTRASMRSGLGWGILFTLAAGGIFYLSKRTYRKSK